ncbi:MAG: hypothetical protein H7326_02840 [Bdellovibrionaceae bacterium]|nr:hypothetical protein [Pseudobdellovibrionaceae bacterium]
MMKRALLTAAGFGFCMLTLFANAEPAPTPTPLGEPGMDTKAAIPKRKNMPKTTKDPMKTTTPSTDTPVAPGSTETK